MSQKYDERALEIYNSWKKREAKLITKIEEDKDTQIALMNQYDMKHSEMVQKYSDPMNMIPYLEESIKSNERSLMVGRINLTARLRDIALKKTLNLPLD